MPVIRSQMPVAKRSGKLVKVPIKPGVCVKMHEDDARAQGLLPEDPKPKRRRSAANKKREPVDSKVTDDKVTDSEA